MLNASELTFREEDLQDLSQEKKENRAESEKDQEKESAEKKDQGKKSAEKEKEELVLEIGTEGDVVVVSAPENVEVKLLQTQAQKEETEKEPTALDNGLTIGLVALLVLAVIAIVIRKLTKKNSAPAAPAAEPAPAVVDAPTAPGAAGEVKLNNVEPKTAAMLMAIVADKMQTPINELRFISIKEVE